MNKTLVTLCAAGLLAGGVLVSGQQTYRPEPRLGAGDSVTGVLEGWYYNADGTRAFLVGYYNRNAKQELDIPIGPSNNMEPGGPDLGQPTHFLDGRQWGMFSVPVPRDFKETDSIWWTIVANGKSTKIPLRVHPDYVVSPFTAAEGVGTPEGGAATSKATAGNTPPILRFDPKGKALQGPAAILANAAVRTATAGTPMALATWATDDLKYSSGTNAPMTRPRPPVTLIWSKYRGDGKVTFDKARVPLPKESSASEGTFEGKGTTNVTFSDAGEYVLHVTANDYSGDGGGGFGCCWTTGLVKVTVK